MDSLKRPLHPMPEYVKNALEERGLMNAYQNRPPYQRNDYLGWILRGQQEKTRLKRLNQMIDELKTGDSYMNMKYQAGRHLPGNIHESSLL